MAAAEGGEPPPSSSAVLAGSAKAEASEIGEIQRRVDLLEVERRAGFIDAVVAISMTFLILPLMDAATELLDTKEGTGERQVTALEWFDTNKHKLGGMLLSFLVTAGFWAQNEKLFSRLGYLTFRINILSFLWLCCVVFVPVATMLIGTFQDNEIASYVQYLLLFTLISIFQLGIIVEGRYNRCAWLEIDLKRYEAALLSNEAAEVAEPAIVPPAVDMNIQEAEEEEEKQECRHQGAGRTPPRGGPTIKMLVFGIIELCVTLLTFALVWTPLGQYSLIILVLTKPLTALTFYMRPQLLENEISGRSF